ncbi:hypothetical protein [uncultured Roseobacter sp.]|uniref:hypothetical protein n=1 Tax=uncultured Roseobacter sp. TaxID=114847 RepID=UPI00260286D8|nr:hypothetical protein [uncultured Roseobacter sp.]
MNSFTNMNPLEILGAGAIGLGFLLAVLTFQLLKSNRVSYRPVYAYMAFCLALVLIGAWMQHLSIDARQKLDKIGIQLSRLDSVYEDVSSWNSLTSAVRQPVLATIKDIQADIQALTGE